MDLFRIASLFTLLLSVTLGSVYKERGFTGPVEWHTLEEAEVLAKSNDKPIFVLFTQKYCGASRTLCDQLKSDLSTDREFLAESAKFNMVSIEKEDSHNSPLEPQDGRNWKPDGGYVPRAFFLTSTGVIDHEMGVPPFRHYYATGRQIAAAMRRFLAKLAAHDEL
eukprot:TRINITY_DN2178_c0_g1_i7.p1 TRINITY_DN2178_c0_g1~~TRINITY_DN2178_c0_g1_i7.p1  ORF type:complete len:165 (-),score=19.88 TRINITY_DN2178_c0_g1_i7:129-623(-)